jgi:hypothetical protein
MNSIGWSDIGKECDSTTNTTKTADKAINPDLSFSLIQQALLARGESIRMTIRRGDAEVGDDAII